MLAACIHQVQGPLDLQQEHVNSRHRAAGQHVESVIVTAIIAAKDDTASGVAWSHHERRVTELRDDGNHPQRLFVRLGKTAMQGQGSGPDRDPGHGLSGLTQAPGRHRDFWRDAFSSWRILSVSVSCLTIQMQESEACNDKFWNDTLLGNLIPFTLLAYVHPDNTELISETYKPGYTAIYVKNIKFPTNGDGPFQLVYAPPSFERDEAGPLTGPLIYKINKEYIPNGI